MQQGPRWTLAAYNRMDDPTEYLTCHSFFYSDIPDRLQKTAFILKRASIPPCGWRQVKPCRLENRHRLSILGAGLR